MRFVQGLTLALPLLLLACTASAQVRTTENGPVQGKTSNGLSRFLGIPYAAPPVGDLRWRPPAPPANWRMRSATAYGKHCPQFADLFPSEDCLSLNVFAPATATAGSKLPVLVFIYGGAFMAGQSDMYDPSTIAMAGNLVAVTINYRIGYLGFLAHPALSANDPDHVSGNYGLLDQKAALNWVNRNISNFGGNPAQVTVFGESAGAQSVYAQMITAKPAPFHGGIIASAAFQTNYPTLAEAEAIGLQSAKALGCPDQSLACLKKLSPGKLGSALNPLALSATTEGLPVTPVRDGVHFPLGPATAFASGQFQKVPVIHGINHDEWRLFIGLDRLFGKKPLTAEGYTTNVRNVFGARADAVLAHYPLSRYTQPDYAWAAVLTDSGWACSAQLVNQLLARHVPVYAYEMNDPNGPVPFAPNLSSYSYGSAHGSELSYMFPTLHAPIIRAKAPTLSPAQQAMGQVLQGLWLSFAKSGAPTQPVSTPWPTFTSTNPNVLSFSPSGITLNAGIASDHQCDFWEPTVRERSGLVTP